MLKTYRYRLYPTKAQITALIRTFELCRKVYNNTLALRRDSWDYDQKNLTYFDTVNELVRWKREFPDLRDVHSQVLQNVQVRVDLAFKAFFRRVKIGDNPGYPRFKGRNRYDSITYPQSGFSISGSVLHVSKIGDISIILHRPIDGTIKTMTIRRSSAGKWYVSFAVEYEPGIHDHPGTEIVGIDLGLSSFATFSTGETIANPRFFRSEEKELARVQRKLSKAEKGTLERRNRRLIVAKVHARIANKRSNFIHQISRDFVDRFKLIAFEDLQIINMQKNSHLAKSIADVAWGMMIQTTRNKAVDAGSQVILINPRNTTQTCSRCNQIIRKEMSDRIHSCPFCGLVMDRDQNAAINILRLGTQSLRKSAGSSCL